MHEYYHTHNYTGAAFEGSIFLFVLVSSLMNCGGAIFAILPAVGVGLGGITFLSACKSVTLPSIIRQPKVCFRLHSLFCVLP
jgi:hypothetical protein